MKATLALIAGSLWVLGGCSEDLATCGVQGATISCVCNDGAEGAQTCSPDGIWGSCDCSGVGAAASGGMAGDLNNTSDGVDASGNATETGISTDGGAPVGDGLPADASVAVVGDSAVQDAAPGTAAGAVGTACSDSSECTDGIDPFCFVSNEIPMFPNGYCSASCMFNDCPAGSICVTFFVRACMRTCISDAECRVDEGYACQSVGAERVQACNLVN